MQTENRIYYIDVFRGLGIILMILGHIDYGNYFNHFIHAFNMPMFFLLSGFLYDAMPKVKGYSFFIRKIKTLVIPYLIFGFAHYGYWLLVNWENRSFAPLKNLLFRNTAGLPIAGALWFLSALFFCESFYYIIDNGIKNSVLKHCIIIVLSLFGNCIQYIFSRQLPWALGASLVGLGLFHIGKLIHKYEKTKIVAFCLNLSPILFIIVGGMVILLIFLNGLVNMRTDSYAIIPLFWINAVTATVLGMNLSKKIVNVRKALVVRYIMNVGKHSIVYVCLNQWVISVVTLLLDNFTLPLILHKIITLMLVMLILEIFVYIICNTKLKKIIGK